MEYKEKTGLKIKPKDLLSVSDDFFTYRGECAHSILIFYLVEKISGQLSTDTPDSVEAKWINLKDLSKNNVQEIFWKVLLKQLLNQPRG